MRDSLLITLFVGLLFWGVIFPSRVQAMIGGKTSADGPFLIDGAEDLDLSADSL